MRTPAFEQRDEDERERHAGLPDRQALVEVLAAQEQAAGPQADLAWIAKRFDSFALAAAPDPAPLGDAGDGLPILP